MFLLKECKHNILFIKALDVENDYKYLQVLFSRSGSFFSAKNFLAGQVETVMYKC